MKIIRPPASSRSGFTLIELLVAVGITAVMVAFILSITTNVLNLWTRTTGALNCENQAVLIMDYLTQDFRGLVMKQDSWLDDMNGRNLASRGTGTTNNQRASVWLAASIQPNQSTPKGDSGLPTANWLPTNGGIIKPNNVSGSQLGSSLYLPLSQVMGQDPLLIDPNPPSQKPSTYRFGQAGVWLRFFTTAPDTGLQDAQGTDTTTGNQSDLAHSSSPRAVSYQIIRMQPTWGNKDVVRYLFFRSSVRPYSPDGLNGTVGNTPSHELSTYVIGYDLFTDHPVSNGANGYNKPDSNTYTNNYLGDAGNVRRPGVPTNGNHIFTTQLLANNVIDFGVRFFVRDTTKAINYLGQQYPLKLAFPDPTLPGNKNLVFAVSTQDGHSVSPSKPQIPLVPANVYNLSNITWGFPVAAEVFVRILDDDGVRQIDAIENGILRPPTGMAPDEFWWDTAEKHSFVYTRRIDLPAATLK